MSDRGVIALPDDLVAWGVERVGGVTEDRAALLLDLEFLKPKRGMEHQLDWEIRVRGEELTSLQNQLLTARALLDKAEHETVAIAHDLETTEGDRDAIMRSVLDLVMGYDPNPAPKIATRKNQHATLTLPSTDPDLDADIFKIEKLEYISPGYPIWVTGGERETVRIEPVVKFNFKDSQVSQDAKDATLAKDATNKKQLSQAEASFERILGERAARETRQRKSEAVWLKNEAENVHAEKEGAFALLMQLTENSELRRECWAAEQSFFDEMRQLIETRMVAEREVENLLVTTKRAEKQRALNDANKTSLNLTEYQKAELTAKKRVDALEEEAQQFKATTRRELKSLKEGADKFRVRARKALIQRKQEIGGMSNDVKLLVQRVTRVREGLKKYDVLPGKVLFSDMDGLLRNLEKLARQVASLN